jgi:histidyl-tRNA synthetase
MMATVSTKPPSGMRDFLPGDLARRRHVIEVVRAIYESHGFVPLETPTIENLSTLLGKYGDEGDQLLYRVLHRRDRLDRAVQAGLERGRLEPGDLADEGLRYDLTVPLARVVAQYAELPKFFKRYQIQPVWRADRPGRGRFREFYQCDVDVTGTTSLVAEAEVCTAVARALRALGFSDFELRLNHRRVLRGMIEGAGIPVALEGSALVAVDKLDKIGPEGVLAELAQRGVDGDAALRLLEAVAWREPDGIAALRARLGGEGSGAALDDLAQLRTLLDATAAGPHVQLRPDLARGLSYYTGPIFEIAVPDLAGSLGGGGRYDGLVGMFGKAQVPAVGFSLGLERILVVMGERGMYPELAVGPDVLVCWRDVELAAVLQTAAAVRDAGLRAEVYPEPAKLGKQLQYAAEGARAAAVVIVGPDELAAGAWTLKRLDSGEQHTLARDEATARLREWFRG